MALTLTARVPTGYVTQSGTTWTTTTVGNIDEGIAGADGLFIVAGINSSSSIFYDFTNMPSDFGTMATLSYDIRYKITPLTNDSETLFIQIFKSDRSTALTDEMTVVQTNTALTIRNKGVTAFTGVSTTATKADWDAAVIRIRTLHSAVQSRDDSVWSIDAVELTGTYNISVQTITVNAATCASNALAASVVVPAVTIDVNLVTMATAAQACNLAVVTQIGTSVVAAQAASVVLSERIVVVGLPTLAMGARPCWRADVYTDILNVAGVGGAQMGKSAQQSSITYTAGDFIVVTAAASDQGGGITALDISGAASTWNELFSTVTSQYAFKVWWGWADGGAATITVTVTNDTGTDNKVAFIGRVLRWVDPDNPIDQSVSAAGGGILPDSGATAATDNPQSWVVGLLSYGVGLNTVNLTQSAFTPELATFHSIGWRYVNTGATIAGASGHDGLIAGRTSDDYSSVFDSPGIHWRATTLILRPRALQIVWTSCATAAATACPASADTGQTIDVGLVDGVIAAQTTAFTVGELTVTAGCASAVEAVELTQTPLLGEITVEVACASAAIEAQPATGALTVEVGCATVEAAAQATTSTLGALVVTMTAGSVTDAAQAATSTVGARTVTTGCPSMVTATHTTLTRLQVGTSANGTVAQIAGGFMVVGDLLIVSAAADDPGGGITDLSIAGGGTWHEIASSVQSTYAHKAWWCLVTEIPTYLAVTLTDSGSEPKVAWSGYCLRGGVDDAPLQALSMGTGTGTDVSSGATVVAEDDHIMVVGLLAWAAGASASPSARTFTPSVSVSWSTLRSAIGASTAASAFAGAGTITATTTESFDVTLNASETWWAICALVRPAGVLGIVGAVTIDVGAATAATATPGCSPFLDHVTVTTAAATTTVTAQPATADIGAVTVDAFAATVVLAAQTATSEGGAEPPQTVEVGCATMASAACACFARGGGWAHVQTKQLTGTADYSVTPDTIPKVGNLLVLTYCVAAGGDPASVSGCGTWSKRSSAGAGGVALWVCVVDTPTATVSWDSGKGQIGVQLHEFNGCASATADVYGTVVTGTNKGGVSSANVGHMSGELVFVYGKADTASPGIFDGYSDVDGDGDTAPRLTAGSYTAQAAWRYMPHPHSDGSAAAVETTASPSVATSLIALAFHAYELPIVRGVSFELSTVTVKTYPLDGDVLIVAAGATPTDFVTEPAVTDTLGTSYTKVGELTNETFGIYRAIWVGRVTTGGECSITATIGAGTYRTVRMAVLVVHDVPAGDPIDQWVAAQGMTNGTALDSGTSSGSAAAGDIGVGVFFPEGNATQGTNAESFTPSTDHLYDLPRDVYGAYLIGLGTEIVYGRLSSAGAIRAQATQATSTTWAAFALAIKQPTTGAQTVDVGCPSMVVAAQTCGVEVGALTVDVAAGSVTVAACAATVVEAAQTVDVGAPSATTAACATTVVAAAQTVDVGAPSASVAASAAEVVVAGITIEVTAGSVAVAARSATVVASIVVEVVAPSVALAAASVTAEVGAVITTVGAASCTIAAQPATVASTLTLDVGVVGASMAACSSAVVVAAQTVDVVALALVASPGGTGVEVGGITVSCGALDALVVTQPAVAELAVEVGAASGAVEAWPVEVVQAVTVEVGAASMAVYPWSVTTEGAVVVEAGAATLVAAALALTVELGAVAADLGAGVEVVEARPGTVLPGEVGADAPALALVVAAGSCGVEVGAVVVSVLADALGAVPQPATAVLGGFSQGAAAPDALVAVEPAASVLGAVAVEPTAVALVVAPWPAQVEGAVVVEVGAVAVEVAALPVTGEVVSPPQTVGVACASAQTQACACAVVVGSRTVEVTAPALVVVASPATGSSAVTVGQPTLVLDVYGVTVLAVLGVSVTAARMDAQATAVTAQTGEVVALVNAAGMVTLALRVTLRGGPVSALIDLSATAASALTLTAIGSADLTVDPTGGASMVVGAVAGPADMAVAPVDSADVVVGPLLGVRKAVGSPILHTEAQEVTPA